MIFGSKAIFAIEVEVNNCFYDKFIGEGKFLVYIYDTAYGLDKNYATTFLCIMDDLRKFSQNSSNVDVDLSNYTAYEIAMCYYCQNYSEQDLSMYSDDLLRKSKKLEVWAPEAAFDDGSYLIQFDNNGKTRLVAFKSCSKEGICTVKKKSVSEITLDSNEFKKILSGVYLYLTRFTNRVE